MFVFNPTRFSPAVTLFLIWTLLHKPPCKKKKKKRSCDVCQLLWGFCHTHARTRGKEVGGFNFKFKKNITGNTAIRANRSGYANKE